METMRTEMTGGTVSTVTRTVAVDTLPAASLAVAENEAAPSGREKGPAENSPPLPTGVGEPSTVTSPSVASVAVPLTKTGPGPRIAPSSGAVRTRTGASTSTTYSAVARASFPAASNAETTAVLRPSTKGQAGKVNAPFAGTTSRPADDTRTASPQVPESAAGSDPTTLPGAGCVIARRGGVMSTVKRTLRVERFPARSSEATASSCTPSPGTGVPEARTAPRRGSRR